MMTAAEHLAAAHAMLLVAEQYDSKTPEGLTARLRCLGDAFAHTSTALGLAGAETAEAFGAYVERWKEELKREELTRHQLGRR